MSPEDFRSHLLDGDDHAAARALASATGSAAHEVLVGPGSGLAPLADRWPADATGRMRDLPGIAAPTADGHLDEWRSLELNGRRVLLTLGRTHLYEEVGRRAVTAAVRIAAAAGVTRAVLTNANGCLEPWQLGDVVTISDHLNLTGTSPFDGGVFLDPRGVWDPDLTAAARGITQRSGTYAALRGPEYQTVAESRQLAASGAHVVGMSTVHEALMASALGMRVCGLSVVSDLSFDPAPTDSESVLAAAAAAQETLARAIESVPAVA